MLNNSMIADNNGFKLDYSSNGLKPNKINWPLLGGVRFFLAFVVLTEHLGWYLKNDLFLKFSKFSPLVAVLGFLVISGFSIAASFEADRHRFYFRRLLRIIPIYVLSILISESVAIFDKDILAFSSYKLLDYANVIGNLFFMQGFLLNSLKSNPIVWTLSIEVFFYILAPYLKSTGKSILFFIILSAFLFLIQRYLGFVYYSQMRFGLGVVFLGWAWLIGYWYYHHRNLPGAIYFLTSIGVICITINGFFINDFWTITWILTCTALGYGHLITLPVSGVMKMLGDVSYPMYLLHIPVFKIISDSFHFFSGFYYFMIIVMFSLLVDRLFDKPIKSYLKNKFY